MKCSFLTKPPQERISGVLGYEVEAQKAFRVAQHPRNLSPFRFYGSLRVAEALG